MGERKDACLLIRHSIDSQRNDVTQKLVCRSKRGAGRLYRSVTSGSYPKVEAALEAVVGEASRSRASASDHSGLHSLGDHGHRARPNAP